MTWLRENPWLCALLALGALLRLFAAVTQSAHIDEAASVLAVQQAAAHGVPILPSGTLYLQGATLSWLSAPLAWAGVADLHHLPLLRLSSVLFGTASIGVMWTLVRRATVSTSAATVAALLLAVDPFSVRWSGLLRPYALLQLLTLALLWQLVELLRAEAPERRQVVAIAGLVTVAVFTHIGIGLVLPALGIAVVLHFGRDLLSARRDVLAMLAVCVAAPLLFLVLNQSAEVTSASPDDPGASLSFVGNHLLALDSLRSPQLRLWFRDFPNHGFNQVQQVLFLMLNGVALWSALTTEPARLRTTLAALLLFTWSGFLAVALLTSAPAGRYVLHLHTLELGILGLASWLLWCVPTPSRIGRLVARGLAVGCVAGLVSSAVETAWNRREGTVIAADYAALFPDLRARHTPGEPILVAMPPVAWLELVAQRDDLVFLAGPEDGERASRYTDYDGTAYRDFWVGIPSVVSTGDLCAMARQHTPTWIVVDQGRLDTSKAFRGSMAALIEGMSSLEATGPGEALLFRTLPEREWPYPIRVACSLRPNAP